MITAMLCSGFLVLAPLDVTSVTGTMSAALLTEAMPAVTLTAQASDVPGPALLSSPQSSATGNDDFRARCRSP